MTSNDNGHYATVYFPDLSLLSFVNERSKDFGSRAKYFRALVEKDQNGLVAWEGDIDRDRVLEILKEISERLGIEVGPKHAEKLLEIGTDLTKDEVISVLVGEGIL